jgi:PPK2 family polyphosphate:nucleotide phosphotransferase
MKTHLSDFRFTKKKRFVARKAPTKIKDIYKDDADYERQMAELRLELDARQKKMFAHNRHSMLVIFQAMDAAGKDSTLTHVFTGVNPMGVEVSAFKKPSEEELDHDFLWRTTTQLPQRGRIGVFNRSYYEEVLICKVHPEYVTKVQRLPEALNKDSEKLFRRRYESISEFEQHLTSNGTHVVKFFLNVSKKEQARRFLARLDDPSKNWKFNEADLAEREHWSDYIKAYEDAINETATDAAPWYVIPADDKKTMRLLVATAVLAEMRKLKLSWPKMSEEQMAGLERGRKKLAAELR